MTHLAILGAGSWGTAIAHHLASKGQAVRLWSRGEDLSREICESRENARYLPGIKLPQALEPTSDLEYALTDAAAVFFVVPSHGLRELANTCAQLLPPLVPLVSATKGIENTTLMLMTDVLAQELGEHAAARLCAIGGPSFAREVASGMPTAICVAGHDHDTAKAVQRVLAGTRLRVYSTEDLVGLELGGALKNVIALAAGAADGLGFGHNARAGLITRGVAEISRLATHLGANPQTLAGLSGMGDLVLTCTGDLSRNRQVGLELGRGRSLEEVLGEMTMVAEGVRTAKSAYHLALRERVDMPITTEVYLALYEGKSPAAAVESLLSRALRPERD
ncbi:MAG: NAD(P)-dependent glycerol-3-phosphate dehydrogenase [Myxococcales bacterium]|nr:NAD(P)-dependent glycerol-3-phosphate dehydrogenase [Myxococcales bacterium]